MYVLGARIALAGPMMPLKLAALGGAYLFRFRAWLGDESQDLEDDGDLGQAA